MNLGDFSKPNLFLWAKQKNYNQTKLQGIT